MMSDKEILMMCVIVLLAAINVVLLGIVLGAKENLEIAEKVIESMEIRDGNNSNNTEYICGSSSNSQHV